MQLLMRLRDNLVTAWNCDTIRMSLHLRGGIPIGVVMGIARIAAPLLAVGMVVCLAVPGHALTFASFRPETRPSSSENNLAWSNTGSSTGSLTNIGNDKGRTAVRFDFKAFGLPSNLTAHFDLTATSTSSAAVAFGVLLVQPGITGVFHFKYDGPNTVIGGVMFKHGANLLSGTFDNAFINGIVGGVPGSLQSEITTTGPINFTSDFLRFQSPCCGDEAISLAFNGITPTLHIDGNFLGSFSASTTGNFSADVVALRTAKH
jgi:hypothetical protein